MSESPTTPSKSAPRMPLADALRVLHAARGGDVVITSMGTARDWQDLPPHPLDLVQIPSSMGQTPAWGLGVALAQPQRRVIACCGDGSLLMNLGCLVTIANAAPPNLTLLVFDNGIYEVTGGQPTPAVTSRRLKGQPVDFTAIALECGFRHVERIETLTQWEHRVEDLLNFLGPVCVVLRVAPVSGDPHVRAPGRPKERARQFAAALQADRAPA